MSLIEDFEIEEVVKSYMVLFRFAWVKKAVIGKSFIRYILSTEAKNAFNNLSSCEYCEDYIFQSGHHKERIK